MCAEAEATEMMQRTVIADEFPNFLFHRSRNVAWSAPIELSLRDCIEPEYSDFDVRHLSQLSIIW